VASVLEKMLTNLCRSNSVLVVCSEDLHLHIMLDGRTHPHDLRTLSQSKSLSSC
jgi:hypothetical protein